MRLKLFFLFFTLLNTNLGFADPSIKIGVSLPLTGGAASNGETIKNSILMASKDNDQEKRVKFIFEDDRLEPAKTVSNVSKFLKIDKVDGLIIFGSPTSLAVNSIAEKAKIPMIGLSIVEKVVKDKKYVVKHWVTTKVEAMALNKEFELKNYNSIAIVTLENDAMLALRKDFVNKFSKNIVLDEQIQPKEIDFKAIITKIKRLNPDAVYNLLWSPQVALFSKQLRNFNYKGEIFGAHNLENIFEIKAANGALENVWFVSGDDCHSYNYYTAYRKIFNQEPVTGGINGYDAAKLFITGAMSGDINKHLHTVKDFDGAYGRYSATGSNDFDIKAAIKLIKDGKIVCK